MAVSFERTRDSHGKEGVSLEHADDPERRIVGDVVLLGPEPLVHDFHPLGSANNLWPERMTMGRGSGSSGCPRGASPRWPTKAKVEEKTWAHDQADRVLSNLEAFNIDSDSPTNHFGFLQGAWLNPPGPLRGSNRES